jgi:hypothetical protein
MTIILELTDAEASALATITLSGILWSTPKIGKAARDIYYALTDADVMRTPGVRYNRLAEFTVEEEVMSDKIEFVLELTRDEALGIMALIGPTYGVVGYRIYEALQSGLGIDYWSSEAEERFPTLKGGGEFA